MVHLDSRDGSLSVPDALVQAVSQLAERHADLTADWLESAGFLPHQPLGLSEAFLLELAAVLQVGEWERQGVLDHLDVKLPTYRQAADELAARAIQGSKEFQGPDATRFSTLVNWIWIERFAWDGPSMLQADIVLAHCKEADLVEQLAMFLFEYRHELEKLNLGDNCDVSQ